MFDFFRKCSSNPHHVCCEGNFTKGRLNVYNNILFSQSDDLALRSRSQLHLRLEHFFGLNSYYNSHFLDSIAVAFKLDIRVD